MRKAKTSAPVSVRIPGGNAKREALMGYILVAPAVVLLFTFTVYPLFYLLYRSLFGGSLITKNPSFVGLDNYADLLTSRDFAQTLQNTLYYTVVSVGLTMALALVIAAWLSGKRNKKLNNLVQTFIFTPHVTSMASIATLFSFLMDTEHGLFNAAFKLVGLAPYSFLSSPNTALFSVTLVSVWKGLGYYVLLFLAAIQNIPSNIYEAAEVDDTPAVRTFFKITLPMISPTILFVSVVATISSFRVFDSINIMTGGGPLNSTNTLVYFIYQYAFKYGKPGLACAGGIVLLLFIIVVTIIQFKVGEKRVHYQ